MELDFVVGDPQISCTQHGPRSAKQNIEIDMHQAPVELTVLHHKDVVSQKGCQAPFQGIDKNICSHETRD